MFSDPISTWWAVSRIDQCCLMNTFGSIVAVLFTSIYPSHLHMIHRFGSIASVLFTSTYPLHLYIDSSQKHTI